MTIGIGVLCSTKPKPYKPRPDALVMIADTMGSSEIDSTGELHKMFVLREDRIYAVCAGQMERASELVGAIHEALRGLGERTHGTVWISLSDVANAHRSEHFKYDVLLPRYSPEFGRINPLDRENVLAEWQVYSAEIELLVGTFDEEGRSLIYWIGKSYERSDLVHAVSFPGFGAIGLGSFNANMWFNQRHQKLSLSVRQSALHAYEASRMAASAPSVNEDIEILIATKERVFHIT